MAVHYRLRCCHEPGHTSPPVPFRWMLSYWRWTSPAAHDFHQHVIERSDDGGKTWKEQS